MVAVNSFLALADVSQTLGVMSMSLLEWLNSAKGELAIAGLAGSAVSAVMEWEGVGPGIRRLFVGACTAYFLGPIGVPLFEWLFGTLKVPSENAVSFGGFVVGITGVILVEIILKTMRLRKKEMTKE